jgi:hypothetical protein
MMDAVVYRILLIPLAFVALLTACQDGDGVPSRTETTATTTSATAGATSGIEGQVLLGPTCPVEREGVSCEEPYEATIVVWDAARTQRVFVFDSDDHGRFHVGLSPGEYYIEPQGDQQGLPRPEPQTVTVPANTFVLVTLHYDTGIR